MVALIFLFLNLIASPFKSKGRLEAENAALRQQLIVLRRKVRGRVRFTNSDRVFFIQLYRWCPSVLKAMMIIRPVVPENSVRADWRDEGESEHHPTRCLPSSICFEHLSPTRSSCGAGLRSRTSFFAISSILL
jgi:hypothetical protein